jgi:DNA-binding GntR family transcriptional regulator
VHEALRVAGVAVTLLGRGTAVGNESAAPSLRRIPIYRQVAGALAERIRSGELKPHRAIPSEKTLVRQYAHAKVTVRHAVQHLREEGWVYTVPNRGTYVSSPAGWPS